MNSELTNDSVSIDSLFTCHYSQYYLLCCLQFVAAVEIVGVQLFVAEVAARFAIVFLVDGNDLGVLVALTDGLASIFAVDGFHTFADDVAVAVVIGLASAADTTTGASHNLDEVVSVGVAVANLFHNLASVAKAVSHSNLQREAVEIDGGFLDALESAGFFEVDLGQFLASVDLVSGTESCFHHTTSGTEDDSSTSRLAERTVEVLFRHVVQVEVALTDHVSQFTCGQREVHVAVAVDAEFFTSQLALLGQAGHDRNDNEIFAFHTQFRCQVVLGNSAEHTLGRLGGRRIFKQIGEVLLVEGDPSGAAGGEHRQFDLFACEGFLQAAEELGAFFHDGEVGAPVSVVHLVETKTTEGGSHFSGDNFAGFHAELFTQSHADCGSGLDNDFLGRIGNGLEDIADVVDEGEGSNGAHLNALAAVDAAAVTKVLFEGGSNNSLEATVDTAQSTSSLEFVAHGLATTAHDAFVHVAIHAESAVLTISGGRTFEGNFLDAETFGEALEFAVTILLALQTVVRVVAENQLNNGFAGVDNACAVGQHFHAFHYIGGASRGQVAAAFHFDHADTASAGFVFKIHPIELEMAERGDIDTVHAGSLENGGAFGNLNRFIIYCEIDHCSIFIFVDRLIG